MRLRWMVRFVVARLQYSAYHAPPKVQSSLRQPVVPSKLISAVLPFALPVSVVGALKSQFANTQSVVAPVRRIAAALLPNWPVKPRKVTDAQPFRVSTGCAPPIAIAPPSPSNSTGFAGPWPVNDGIVHGP